MLSVNTHSVVLRSTLDGCWYGVSICRNDLMSFCMDDWTRIVSAVVDAPLHLSEWETTILLALLCGKIVGGINIWRKALDVDVAEDCVFAAVSGSSCYHGVAINGRYRKVALCSNAHWQTAVEMATDALRATVVDVCNQLSVGAGL